MSVVALELEKQGTSGQTNRNQHPENCSSTKNLRGHGGGFRFSTHLTILPAPLAANLKQAVERCISAHLSGHDPAHVGLIPLSP